MLWLYFVVNSFGNQHEGAQNKFLSFVWTLWDTGAMGPADTHCAPPLLQEFGTWVTESCSVVSDSLWPHELYSPWNSPGQNTGVGILSLL